MIHSFAGRWTMLLALLPALLGALLSVTSIQDVAAQTLNNTLQITSCISGVNLDPDPGETEGSGALSGSVTYNGAISDLPFDEVNGQYLDVRLFAVVNGVEKPIAVFFLYNLRDVASGGVINFSFSGVPDLPKRLTQQYGGPVDFSSVTWRVDAHLTQTGSTQDTYLSNTSVSGALCSMASSPTSTPTSTSTSTPTSTATSTAISTATSTTISTASSTEPSTATSTASSTETNSPTETTEPGSIGTAIVTVMTGDGSSVPDGTVVCLGDQCQSLDGMAASAVPSGTQAVFSDLAAGTYPLSVFVGVAQVYSGDLVVTAGEIANATVVISAPGPTNPGGGTPETGVVGPGNGDGSGNGNSVDDGNAGDQDTTDGSVPAGGPGVTSLPSTGTGSSSPVALYFVLLVSAGLIATAGTLAWKQRRIG